MTSPTYALVHRYVAPKSPVYHVDLYRLDDPTQLTNIGWDDLLSNTLRNRRVARSAGSRIPPDHLPIDIDYVDGRSRPPAVAGRLMSEYTLALEGSTYAGSVALTCADHEIIAERTLADRGTRPA